MHVCVPVGIRSAPWDGPGQGVCVCVCVCACVCGGGARQTMERNLNESKKGIRDVREEDERGFGTIVVLLFVMPPPSLY